MKTKKMKLIALSTLVFALTAISCNNAKKTSDENEKLEVEVVETPVIVETIWIIDEHRACNTIPLTTLATTESEDGYEESVDEALDREMEYEMLESEDIHEALSAECEPITEELTIVAIPIGETETVVAYNKKGKNKGEIQVVSSANGDIEQIVFTKGKHKDVYDVETGLSGKEVRKLRREMKHMVKKGQVFMYSESSNVMYLMDDSIVSGDEVLAEDITIEDVEQMNVEAIIWKDKKHHKKKK